MIYNMNMNENNETDARPAPQKLFETIRDDIKNNVDLTKLGDKELKELIEDRITAIAEKNYMSLRERIKLSNEVYGSIRGLGILDLILSDDQITEIMINGKDNIFVEKNGRLQKLDARFEDDKRLEDIIQRIVASAGREVNQSNPIVDTRLADGSRVNVVLPPVALCGPTVTIRKFSKTPMTIEKLIRYGSITEDIAHKLELLVRSKYNIFISGGTGSGKTTFLNALSNYIPKDERVITIEDSAELQIVRIE